MFQEAAEQKGGTFLIFLIAGHFDSSKLPDLEGSRECAGSPSPEEERLVWAAQLGTPSPWAGEQLRCINILRS